MMWLPADHVAELERQLEAAQQDLARLASENDSIMDISNALAAEKRRGFRRQDAAGAEGKSRPMTVSKCTGHWKHNQRNDMPCQDMCYRSATLP